MSSFDKYTRPSPNFPYSSSFFMQLTFAEASKLDMPDTFPEGALINYVFLLHEPGPVEDDLACFIGNDDLVLASSDLLPIMAELKAAFDAGNRSVALTIQLQEGIERTNVLHFQKLHLFRLINNNREAVSLALDLYYHVQTSLSSLLPVDVVAHLHNSCITGAMRGCTASDFPLWKLGTLLYENYVDEDVMNSLCELAYFCLAAAQPRVDPTFLILLTLFFNNTVYQDGRVDSPNMEDLRERDSSSFIHEAAFSALKQLIEGINLPQVSFMLKGAIKHQHPGSGSCGIGALAWIESMNNSSAPVWTNQTSSLYCDCFLSDLLLYNMLSEGLLSSQSHWYSRCLTCSFDNVKCKTSTNVNVGYEDYNMLAPGDSHPMYAFISCQAVVTSPSMAFDGIDNLFAPSKKTVLGLGGSKVT
ncbi:hypothetical protein BT96DRAFT_1001183 [Gymnopus androsaceus JB14]|uniref:Uncharacterized protein n=1 Tax=Gymnopus androsaceus JB14 TaxID=1447944 RepID=A0A6A4H1N9_9AGAR|nr:hypothetical protein BT96DRAFT_1001183 [Gymnopus androsaceus JB14]